MRNIIYIINPISGTGAQRGLEKLIEQKSKSAGLNFEIFPSVTSGDYSFLLPIIKEKKITDVVIDSKFTGAAVVQASADADIGITSAQI